MPIYQEATFHDRQSVINEDENFTSSLVYVDLPGASMTTKSLAIEGCYIATFSFLVSASLNNTLANFRLLIDDVPFGVDGANIKLKTKDLDIGYSLNIVLRDVPINSILKVQYKTDKGAVTVSEFNAAMDGIPQSRVVE